MVAALAVLVVLLPVQRVLWVLVVVGAVEDPWAESVVLDQVPAHRLLLFPVGMALAAAAAVAVARQVSLLVEAAVPVT